VNQEQHRRRLSIGEFSAATQLSPKALRLYDEQGLLRPSAVDRNNGYRYYSREQIATARLIRTLREMDLSLAQIGDVIAAGNVGAERFARSFTRGDTIRSREESVRVGAIAAFFDTRFATRDRYSRARPPDRPRSVIR
jgi:DNA-binding transcriptional MerR regulator